MKILRLHQSETIDALETVIEGIVHLPTGSGKTFIQATTIVNNLQNDRVFVVLSPRILLTNQLYNEVKEILLQNQKDCQYLIVHSGKAEDKSDMQWTNDMPYREVKSTTKIQEIKDEYERSNRENVPLIIFGTYDSSERIVSSNIPIYMLLCDEAHYLVSEEFAWIKYERYNDGRFQFDADRKYYFTATLKNTASDDGLGMNNSKEFGPIIYSKTPLDMVIAGEIIRPRMHLVNVTSQDATNELDMDVNAILDSFTEHKLHCNIAPKLLVVTKGSEHLNQIVNHPKILEKLETSPNLRIFDITSAHKPRINGEIVKREQFLSELQSMTDYDEAIILHVRILTEGIDVPGITGVIIMNDLSLSNFLQTIGRSTRLYSQDRTNLYSNKIKYDEIKRFVKPFAWIIIPVYGLIGDDLRTNIQSMIYSLRTFGFNASEDVVIRESKGRALPVALDQLNVLDERGMMYKNTIMEIVHDVEAQEIAEKLTLDESRMIEEIKNMSINELINKLI
jgi:superfamily II DNA or RNA helicase